MTRKNMFEKYIKDKSGTEQEDKSGTEQEDKSGTEQEDKSGTEQEGDIKLFQNDKIKLIQEEKVKIITTEVNGTINEHISVSTQKEENESEVKYDYPIPKSILPWKNDEKLLIEYTEKLIQAGYIKTQLISSATISEIQKHTGIPEYYLAELIQNAQNWSDFNFESAATMYNQRAELMKISTGCQGLDNILGGGIEAKAITEFYGEFITGKTQICIQLAIRTIISKDQGGIQGRVIYIDTEGSFNPERVVQICNNQNINPTEVLNKIMVGRAYTTDVQLAMVDNIIKFNKDNSIKLIIVDSLTSNFRSEFTGKNSIYDRQQKLNRHIQQLSRIADIYNIAVVITNQVMSSMNDDNMIKPVGGNILAHGTTHRIYCSKSKIKSNVRFAKLVASPSLPDAKTTFQITENGVEDI